MPGAGARSISPWPVKGLGRVEGFSLGYTYAQMLALPLNFRRSQYE